VRMDQRARAVLMTYNYLSPALNHEWAEMQPMTSYQVNVGNRIIMIIPPFLVNFQLILAIVAFTGS
jgi:hypothetical protein